MSCSTHFLGFEWRHHHWHRRVKATETVPTAVTDMWGRKVAVEHVRCRTEEACDSCGAIRDTGYCFCDSARGDACAVRLQHLDAARSGTGPGLTTAASRRARAEIHGFVKPGFTPVLDAFAENFSRRHELGGACCVYRHGEKVVDLWGGVRNKATGEPWEEHTMVLVHSTTKGLSAMTLALAHSRGWLDYDERVCKYWPEFAQNGKQHITVRQLLAHQAGLFAFDEQSDRGLVADLDRLAVVLARQTPAWEPGTRHGYHAITIGYYENELLRRVDPKHRSIGVFFEDEIASPLGASVYIRLPDWISTSRLATMSAPSRLALLCGFPLRLTIEAFNKRSNIVRALVGADFPLDPRRIYTRGLEVPAGSGVGTARGIARAYGVFAAGGQELHLRPETLQQLSAPAVQPTHGLHDECMKGDVKYSLGFMKPGPVWQFGGDSAFGAPGAGGSFAFADPKTGIGYAYVTNQMGTHVTGDPRDLALRKALDVSIGDG